MERQIAYHSGINREDINADTIVIHCSDHRFRGSFHEFLTEGLKLDSYALLAIPGGAHIISMEQVLPKFAKVGWQSLSFLIKRGKPRRIVLIGHDDCLFFKERLQFFFLEADFNQKQFASLQKAQNIIMERFQELLVELYFAFAHKNDPIQFFRIR
jgi:hypothetical protein